MGSFFFLKYSIILLIIETMIICIIQYFLVHVLAPRFRLGSNFEHVYHIEIYGTSGLVCGWMAFLSTQNFEPSIYLIGVMACHPAVAVILCTLISQFLMFSSGFVASAGLISGYLVLLMPFNSNYWSICFFINLLLVLSWKSHWNDLLSRIPTESHSFRFSGVNYQSLGNYSERSMGIYGV